MNSLDPGLAPVVVPSDEPAIEPAVVEPDDGGPTIDLDVIERDLRDVESALARLADGTYFTEEPGPAVTEEPGADSSVGAVD